MVCWKKTTRTNGKVFSKTNNSSENNGMGYTEGIFRLEGIRIQNSSAISFYHSLPITKSSLTRISSVSFTC